MIYRFLKTWLLPIVALIAVGIALATYESDYLFKVQELNLFLYSKMFFEQQMVVSGGLLTWLGPYFTQYFYYPALGTTLYGTWCSC